MSPGMRWFADRTPVRAVWLVAGAVGAVIAALLAIELALPRDAYTGTNNGENAGATAGIVAVPPGARLCVPALRLPAGTARVRVGAIDAAPTPVRVRAEVRAGGQSIVRTVVAAPSATVAPLDVPIPPRPDHPASVPAALCLRPLDGALTVAGRVGLQSNERAPTVDGAPLGDQIAVRYLPPASERPSLLSHLGEAARRAALFRPGFVGPWTYIALLAVLGPLLCVLGVRLLARAVGGESTMAPALTVAAIAFALGASWALLSPPLTSPDEAEHFAYAQHLAETGRPPALGPGPRAPYSSEERVGFEGIYLLGQIGQRESRPPWLVLDERRWAERERRERPARDDGGGQVSVASYGPLYYAAIAPAYFAARDQSIWSRIFALRLVSALLGAVTAACAFALVRELLPSAPWAAVAAGLLVAFQPMFTFMSGSINNDAAVNALAALALYLLVRGLRRGLTPWTGAALGIVLVALPLAKTSGWFLYPAAAIGLSGMAWRRRGPSDLRAYGMVAGGFAAAFAAWAVAAGLLDRDLIQTQGGFSLIGGAQFHPVLTGEEYSASRVLHHPTVYLSYVWQVFAPRLPCMTDLSPGAYTLPAFNIFVERGWAAFGLVSVLFPRWVYAVIAAAMGAVALMAVVAARREWSAVRARAWELAVLAAAVVAVVAGFEAVYFSPTPGRTFLIEQGRYAFPALVALTALVVGACFAFGRRAAPLVATALVTAVMGLQLASQLLVLSAAYT